MANNHEMDYYAALACLDAYIFLRDKSEEALSLLRENKEDEAERKLAFALSFSPLLYNGACDMSAIAD